MVLKDNGCKKKKRLDFKCSKCKKRFSTEELLNLGFAEKIANGISVICPNCEEPTFVKK